MTLPKKIKLALQEVLLAILEIMQENFSSSNMPWRVAHQLKITGRGSSTMADKIEPDYGIWLVGVSQKIKNRSSYHAFCRAIDADGTLSRQLNTLIGTMEARRRIDHDHVILSFAWRYLEATDYRFTFDQSIFERTCQELYEFFTEPLLDIIYTAVLEHFDTDVSSLEVLPNTFIRGLSADEIEKLWNKNRAFQNQYPFYSSYAMNPSQIKGVIEVRIATEKIMGEVSPEPEGGISTPSMVAKNSLDLVLTALRLQKAGPVAIGLTYSRHSNWLFDLGSATSGPKLYMPWGPTYFLSNSDVDELKVIAQALNSIGRSKEKSLDTALRRLGFATERIGPEDKLIDAMIAFEAMILSDAGVPQERGELRFRLSLRVAHLLGGSSEQKERNFDIMRKAYDLRSKVVHGDSLSHKDVENVEKALELCRQCAKTMVLLRSRGDSPDWKRWLFES